MIGIIAAMTVEMEKIQARMTVSDSETISGIEFVRGTLEGREVVAAVCGIGKVFAAVCTQTMILRYRPECIINTGVAGTLTDLLAIGDIAIADQVVQYDMDTSALGDPVGMVSGINQIYFPADVHAVAAAQQALRQLGLAFQTGTIASGDRFLSDSAVKTELHTHFGAIACEMEGGAIGHVCFVNRVPFLILRAISDGADPNAHMDYPAFTKLAADRSSKVLCALVQKL